MKSNTSESNDGLEQTVSQDKPPLGSSKKRLGLKSYLNNNSRKGICKNIPRWVFSPTLHYLTMDPVRVKIIAPGTR